MQRTDLHKLYNAIKENNRARRTILLNNISWAYSRDIVWKIATSAKKKKESSKIKVTCSLHSFFVARFFFTTQWSCLSSAVWRHKNCSIKIRYNHFRRAPSETDSFSCEYGECPRKISLASRTYFCFHFEDALSYHPEKGSRMTSFQSAFLAKSFNFDISPSLS